MEMDDLHWRLSLIETAVENIIEVNILHEFHEAIAKLVGWRFKCLY